ncbi:hypothetical protein ACS2TZ_36805, partial [Bacillus cereus group sp. Bce025]
RHLNYKNGIISYNIFRNYPYFISEKVLYFAERWLRKQPSFYLWQNEISIPIYYKVCYYWYHPV